MRRPPAHACFGAGVSCRTPMGGCGRWLAGNPKASPMPVSGARVRARTARAAARMRLRKRGRTGRRGAAWPVVDDLEHRRSTGLVVIGELTIDLTCCARGFRTRLGSIPGSTTRCRAWHQPMASVARAGVSARRRALRARASRMHRLCHAAKRHARHLGGWIGACAIRRRCDAASAGMHLEGAARVRGGGPACLLAPVTSARVRAHQRAVYFARRTSDRTEGGRVARPTAGRRRRSLWRYAAMSWPTRARAIATWHAVPMCAWTRVRHAASRPTWAARSMGRRDRR